MDKLFHLHSQDLLDTLMDIITNAITTSSSDSAEIFVKERIVKPEVQDRGKDLVRALEQFIKAVVDSRQSDREHIVGSLASNKQGDCLNMNMATLNHVANIPKELPDCEPFLLLDTLFFVLSREAIAARYFEMQNNMIIEHVFNKMPIRLLAFDMNGRQLELIERNEIVRRLIDVFPLENKRIWSETIGINQDKVVSEFMRGRMAGYAILSHTWIRDTPGDVVYKDWDSREANTHGYAKIANFCKVAAKVHGVYFGWMDTICINKDSSSELDESIRSMYKWYRKAHVCVAYLSETKSFDAMHLDSWFTRGWTLQELLAPKYVEFYNAHWSALVPHPDTYQDLPFPLGDFDIRQQIYQATSITERELFMCKQGDIHKIPLSRRIQMASARHVTREEDTVYSLMGMLGVDMSVAYGEGFERAFRRLIGELLNTQRNVLDLFNCRTNYFNRLIPSGPLWMYGARSSVFDATGPEKTSLLDQWQPIEPITLTHLGVRVPLLLVPGRRKRYNFRHGHPLGVYFGVVERGGYELLDSRIYNDEACEDQAEVGDEALPPVATFGVLNFGADFDNVLLPQLCLPVPLDCGATKVGRVGTSDNIRIIASWVPDEFIFHLKSTEEGTYIVPKNELQKHGMQIVTLCL